jgi:hypothetical protein
MEFKSWLLTEQALNSIINHLQGFYSGGVPDSLMSNVVYHYLTQHDDRSNLVSDTLTKDPAKYQQYNASYKQVIHLITQKLSTKGWTADDGGAWIEWFRNGVRGGTKSDSMTSKRYISVKPEDMWQVLQSLTILAAQLQNVKTQPGSEMIGFKIPTNFGTFYGHKDNIVIHYYDAGAKSQIEQAVQGFFNSMGKREDNRANMGRTNYGRDAQGTSDSMLVANQVVKNLRHNAAAFQQMMRNPQQLGVQLKNMINQIANNASHRQTAA